MSHRALGEQFHATASGDWPPVDSPLVYVGTREQAVDRQHNATQIPVGTPWTLHHVDVTSDRVHPHLLPDDDGEHLQAAERHPEHDVFPYRNEMEGESDHEVSYAVRPHAVRVIKREALAPIDEHRLRMW